MCVLDVRHRDGGVRHSIVDDGVDADRHRVFRQYLQRNMVQAGETSFTKPTEGVNGSLSHFPPKQNET